MLLTIDAGNTNIEFAVFDKREIKGQWRLSSDAKRTADEYGLLLSGLLASKKIKAKHITNIVISSVVPQGIYALKTLATKYFDCLPMVIGESTLDLGMKIEIDRPQEIGSDRIVASLAAHHLHGDNLIVIDFGTATTFDVIGAKRNYIGGVICPGIHLSIAALHQAAAKLPEIDITKPKKVIGKSTIPAMQSGVYWGYVSMIEGMITRIQSEYGTSMKTIATGGLASLFFGATDSINHIEPNLTILGLQLIYERNQKL